MRFFEKEWWRAMIRSQYRYGIVGVILTIWGFIYWNIVDPMPININYKVLISMPIIWFLKFTLYHIVKFARPIEYTPKKKKRNFAIYLPKIINIGGLERTAYLLAREMKFKIITSYYRKDIEDYFPGIKKHIIKISKSKKEPSMIRFFFEFLFFNSRKYLMIYRASRTIIFPLLKFERDYFYYPGGPPHHWFMDIGKYKKVFGKMGLLNWMDRILFRIILFFVNPNKIIANSKNTSNNIFSMTGKRPKHILYPPLDTKRFRRGKSMKHFLTVLRLSPYKRLDWQVYAFKNTNKKLVIIGNGPLFDEYKREVDDYDNIEMMDIKDDKKLAKYYADCKAFIFTSFNEHFGICPLEAMYCGKPVISVKEGGPLEYIRNDSNGFFIENKEELRKLISKLDDRKLSKMRRACIKTAEKYSFEKFKERFKKIVK